MASFLDPTSWVLWYFYGTLLLISFGLAAVCGFEIYKREIYWTGPAAGLSAAAAGVILFYIAVIDQYLPLPFEMMHIASAIFWCGVCFAFTFGVLALVQIGRLKNQWRQGQRYAWGGMILAFLFQILIVHAASANIVATFPHEALQALDQKLKEAQANPQASRGSGQPGKGSGNGQVRDGYKEFPDLNFKFKIPPPPWFEIDLKSFNPNATLGYMRTDWVQNFMIVAEKAPQLDPSKIASVADLALQITKSQMPDLTVQSQQAREVEGMKGYQVNLEGTVAGMRLRYIWWIYLQNGFYYQLTFWQPAEKQEADLNTTVDQFLPGFKILDPKKEAAHSPAQNQNGTRFNEDFVSKLGYRMNVKNSDWAPWHGLQQSVPQAEFGMTRSSGDFCVIPAALLGQDPSLDLLTQAVLSMFDIKLQNVPASQIKKISEGGYEGRKIEFEKHVQNENLYHQFHILKGNNRAFLVLAAQNLDLVKKDIAALEDGFKRFELEKNPKPLQEAGLDQSLKEAAAGVFNRLGQTLYENGNPKESEIYFRKAHELHPSEGAYFENWVGMMIVLERYQEAYEEFVKNAGKYPNMNVLPLMEARLLYEVGKTDESIKKYQELLESGKDENRVVSAYSSALWELDRKEEAMKLLREHSATQPNDIEMRIQYINLLVNSGEIDKALEELRKLRQDFPYNDEVRKTYYDTLQSQGKHEEAVQLSKEEQAQGRGNYQTYMYQGLSEMELNHYKDAQESFSKAAEMQPADKEVREYLKQLEELLGYGNLEEVQKLVVPVEIPEELTQLPKDAGKTNPFKGNPSYYLNSIVALHYDFGKPIRQTDYRRIKVANEKDLNDFAEFQLQYDSLREAIFVNMLVVRNEKGEVIGNLDSTKFYIVDDSDAGFASHDKILHVPVPGVEVGSTIELMYSRENKNPSDEMEYREVVLKFHYPTVRSQLVLTGSVDRIAAIPLNGVKYEEKKNYKRWYMENTQPFKDSDYLPSFDLVEPMVKMGPAGSNWAAEGDEYLSMMKGVLEPSAELKKIAEKMTASAVTAEEKVEILFRHVQNEYSYNAIEFGLRAMIPQKSDKMAQTRYGDCKDHALLFYHLLKASGIPAYLTLVRMEGEVEPLLPRLEQFDHMIVNVPSYLKNPFLDATNKNIQTDLLPDYLRGEKSLILEHGKSRLADMAPSPEMDSRILSERSMTLEGNDVAVSEKVTLRRYAAENFRGLFRSMPEDEYRAKFQEILSRAGRWILESVSVENLNDRRQPLIVNLKYRIENVTYYVGDKLAGQIPVFWESVLLDITHNPNREEVFQFLYPLVTENRVHFTYPPEFVLDQGSLKPFETHGQMIRAKGSVTYGADNSFQMQNETYRAEGIFPAASYAKAEAESKEVLDAIQAKVVFSKK